jgi:hypothetical protein
MQKPSGIVNIRGKEYETVALRVSKFRQAYPQFSLETEIIHRDSECVVVRAVIKDDAGRVRSTGHAEEYRGSSQINATSATENCETSAIGRALAALGLGGTEFASADEVAHAMTSKPKFNHTARAACEEAVHELDAVSKQMVEQTRDKIVEALTAEKDWDAYSLCESLTDEMMQEKLYLWSLLDSKARGRIKKQAELAKKPKAKEAA